jgi:hypothetical protein
MLSFASADRPAFLLDPGPRPTADNSTLTLTAPLMFI